MIFALECLGHEKSEMEQGYDDGGLRAQCKALGKDVVVERGRRRIAAASASAWTEVGRNRKAVSGEEP